jgi:pseudouridine synthase
LQKILADAGVASRRAAERLILAGNVTVNGRVVTELGTRADPARDDVRVSGKRIGAHAALVYLALHKPPGYVTTASDEYGRATVLDLVRGVPERLFPVGRLDRDSEGLLMLTNDGELAARLLHPRYGVEKEYHVLVDSHPSPETLTRLRRGVVLDGGRTAPADADLLGEEGDGAWLRIILHEGRKRQARRMCEAVGLAVERLLRVRVGPIELGGLASGHHRPLRRAEVAALRRAVGLN